MLPILTTLIPHRIVDHLTLPQVVNVCRHNRGPVRMAIDNHGITFLKEGKIYYKSKDKEEVIQIDTPPILTLVSQCWSTIAMGKDFYVVITPTVTPPVKIVSSADIIQMFRSSGTWDYFLDSKGRLHRAEIGEECCLEPHLPDLPPTSYIIASATGKAMLVDVDGVLRLGDGSFPFIGRIENYEEDIRTELRKRGINITNLQEIYYSPDRNRVFLVKNDGTIKAMIRHRSRYIVTEENYKHFSY